MGWEFIIAILGIVAAGRGLDAWMTHSQKIELHDKMNRWFFAIEKSEVPNRPKQMATFVLGIYENFLTNDGRISLAKFCVGSFFLTSTAFALGLSLDSGYFDYSEILSNFPNTSQTIIFFVSNLLFDFLTVICTVKILKNMTGVFLVDAMLIVLDLFLAIFFGLLSIPFAMSGSAFARIIMFGTEAYYNPYIGFIAGAKHFFSEGFAVKFYSGTVLVPTVIYLLILYLMMFSRLMMKLAKNISLQWFEVSNQEHPQEGDFTTGNNFKPWTLLGLAASFLVLLIKLVMLAFK